MSFLKTLYRKWFPGDTAAHRFFWKYRYSFRDTHLSENEILLNINHPHRQEIIKEFNNFTDVRRILELGSSWGPNLLLLSQIDPKLCCLGIDVSWKMVAAGSQYFKSKNINNIQLINGDMISLKNFADKEFDLILTDASLIYIDKNDILHCAEEMVRISKAGIIMVEFDDENKDPLGQIFQSNWIRDYKALFEKYSSNICKRSIDKEVWPGKWSDHGRIITVYFNQ